MRLLGTLPTWRIVQLSQRAPKQTLTAFIQRVAMAVFHHPFQQTAHCRYPFHQTLEFGQFFAGQRTPAL